MSAIRFGGLASGLDTDSIVKDLMRVQQLKVDREKKAQALITLKQEAWKDMQKKLYNFHIKFSDKMRLGSTFNKTKVTNSNPNVLEISGNTTVLEGTHTINKVERLATSAQVTSSQQLIVDDKIATKDNTLSELGIAVGTVIKFKDESGKEGSVKVEADTKIRDLETALATSLKNSNVRYDETYGRFFISSKKTGESAVITLDTGTDIDKEELKKLGFTAGTVKGQNAEIEYNGVTITSESNNVTVNGITINLKATTDTPVQISAARDTEAIYDWVKDFVTEYNKLIEELNEKLDTKPAKGIEPLTADEREAMSESDIKLWEEKINNSLFYRDEQLSDFVRISRNILGGIHKESYDGKRDRTTKTREYGEELGYKSLASLGIVTGPWEEKGKLHIQGDEDDELYAGSTNKLKEAIEKNPDAVSALLTTIGAKLYEEHNDKLTTSNDIKSSMKFYNDKLMNDKIKSYDKTIETLEDRMYKMENMYYAKFAAMEKMLNAMNNQSMWLSQQLGGN